MVFLYENISGTLVNYYVHCPRQAWLFNAGVHTEDLSDFVKMGKFIDETSFKRKREIDIEGERVKVDFILENKNPIEIHEVKSSIHPRYEHKLQIAFYLFKLKDKGVESVGVIHYPRLNLIVKVSLDEMVDELKRVLDEIVVALNGTCTEKLNLKFCKKCGFFEFCYSPEESEND